MSLGREHSLLFAPDAVNDPRDSNRAPGACTLEGPMMHRHVSARSIALAALATLLVACSEAPSSQTARVGTATSAVISGRESGADEDYVVFLRTIRDGVRWTCTATVIAPNLIVTARHCTIASIPTLSCTNDGRDRDIGSSLAPSPASNLEVFAGSAMPTADRPADAKGEAIFTPTSDTLCTDDLAFVVLDRALTAPVATIDFSTPVRLGDRLAVSGYGITAQLSDGGVTRATERTGKDDQRVNELGPGQIPPRTFAIGPNSVCFGDSGASARRDGQVVGVFSRIDTGDCTFEGARNVFTTVFPFRTTAQAAFERAGVAPPWLFPKGAACASDNDCLTAHCDTVNKTCATKCSRANPECAMGEQCDEFRGTCRVAAPAPEEDCASHPGQTGGFAPSVLLALPVLLLRRRRKCN